MINKRYRFYLPVFGLLAMLLGSVTFSHAANSLPVPKINYAPRHYICYHTTEALTIDGRLDEVSWQKAVSTELFVDIEGNLKANPRFETRAYMLWDSTYFYVAAEMVEPHVWGKLTERDAVIYHDNDFEVFIDPDGDTHEYYELELNALNTVWDLLLIKPYRDGGPAVNAWDIQGLKTAVAINGTLNEAKDVDSGWSVEIAIPWKVLAECAHRPSPPDNYDQWRVNFSRVEWRMDIENGQYIKKIDPKTGKSLPENNWVWSPQGLIAMHYPEMWGIVQFSTVNIGAGQTQWIPDSNESIRWALRRAYYAERNYRMGHGSYTADWSKLGFKGNSEQFKIQATTDLFEISAMCADGKSEFLISQNGRLQQKLNQ